MNILDLSEFPDANPYDLNDVIDVIMFIEQSVINSLDPEEDTLLLQAAFMGPFFSWKTEHCYQYVAYVHETHRSPNTNTTFADTLIMICSQMSELQQILLIWNELDEDSRRVACLNYLDVFRLFECIIGECKLDNRININGQSIAGCKIKGMQSAKLRNAGA